MEINTNDLSTLFNKLMEKIEKSGFERFEINNDYYWNIPTDDSYNMNKPNPQITVGSLYDDYDCLRKMLEDDMSTVVDFERFAHLFIAISYVISSSNRPYIG